MKEIKFHHGALADSYEKQANEQGFTLGKKANLFGKIAFSYNLLKVHGYLTDAQADSVCKKIQKKLVESIKPLEKEEAHRATDASEEFKTLKLKEHNGWILCNERMPEEKAREHLVFNQLACRTDIETQMISDTMNVTVRNKHDQTVFVSDDCTTNGKWFNFDGEDYEVIAWQPLPEPYREV